MRFRTHSIFTLVLALAMGWALFVALGWPLRASILVLTLGGLAFLFVLIQFYKETRPKAEKLKSSGMDIELEESQELGKNARRAADISAWMVGCVVGISLFGFFIALPVWSFLYSIVHGSKWYTAVFIGILSFAFLWGIFESVIHIPWPEPYLRQFLPGAG